jgi:hypothetical protein
LIHGLNDPSQVELKGHDSPSHELKLTAFNTGLRPRRISLQRQDVLTQDASASTAAVKTESSFSLVAANRP